MRNFYLTLTMLALFSMFASQLSAQISAGDEEVLNTLYEELGMGDHGWSWDADAKSVITNGSYTLPGITVSATGFVTKIELAGKGLVGILPEDFNPPENVGALTKLKILDLNNNPNLTGKITPDLIGFLGNIEELNLAKTGLTGAIPEEIGSLSKLTLLNLSETSIKKVTLNGLKALTTLSLGNSVVSLTLGGLDVITSLTIPKTITDLDVLANALPLLTQLDLSSSSLNSLTIGTGSLAALTELNLFKCTNISSLPENIGILSNLKILNAAETFNLPQIPVSIGDLSNLEELNLQRNNLESLPTSIGNLTKLEKLNIWSNSLTVLPNEIGNLTNLTSLQMFTNFKLEAIPASINNLSKLYHLNLSNTSLSNLPEDLSGMAKLGVLHYQNNLNTTVFPAGVFTLPALKEMNFTKTPITSVPEPTTVNQNLWYANMKNSSFDFCDYENFKQGFPSCNPVNLSHSKTNGDAIVVSKNLGESVTFEAVQAGGCNASNNKYLWQEKGEYTWANAEGTNNVGTYTIPTVSKNSQFRCMVTNDLWRSKTDYSSIYNLNVKITDWLPNITVNNLIEDQSNTVILSAFLSDNQKKTLNSVVGKNTPMFEIVSGPAKGKIIRTIPSMFTFIYKGNQDYFGEDQLEVKVTVGELEETATITLNIENVNDKPVLKLFKPDNSILELSDDFQFETTFPAPIQIKAEIDDSKDLTQAATEFSITKKSATSGGALSYDATTKLLTYTPTQDIDGTDVLTLSAKELDGLESATNLLRVTINKAAIPNKKPIAIDATYSIEQGKLLNFVFSATDEQDARDLTYTITQEINKNDDDVFIQTNDLIAYRPGITTAGEKTIKYTATDRDGAVSDEATVTITVFEKQPEDLGLIELTDEFGKKELVRSGPNYPIPEGYSSHILSFENDSWVSATSGLYYHLNNLATMINVYTGVQIATHINTNADTIVAVFTDPFTGEVAATQRIKLIAVYNSNMEFITTALPVIWTFNFPVLFLNFRIIPPAPPRFNFPHIFNFPFGSPNLDNRVTLKSLNTTNESPTVYMISDTLEVNYGDTLNMAFEIYTLDGEVQAIVSNSQSLGNLLNFQFYTSVGNSIYYYVAQYIPSENTEGYDDIELTLTNASETKKYVRTIHVMPVKEAPHIGILSDVETKEDQSIQIELGITDSDTPLEDINASVQITSNAEGFEFIVSGDVLTITPPLNFNGEAFVEVAIYDTDNLRDNANFRLTVTPENDAPEITAEESYSVDYANSFSTLISTEDIDEDAVTITVSNLPAWLSSTPAGNAAIILLGTPTAQDAGTYEINLSATDGTITVEKTASIVVVGPEIDNPPVVANTLEDIELAKGSAPIKIDVSNLFTDVDEDLINISVLSNTNTEWINVEVIENELIITIIDPALTGISNLILQGESNGLTAFVPFKAFTDDTAPVAGTIEDVNVDKNASDISINLAEVFSDADSDPLNIAVAFNGLPEVFDASIVDNNLILKFAEGKAGSTTIAISAEAFGKSVETAFEVSINDLDPYIYLPVQAQSFYKNESVEINLDSLFVDDDDASILLTIDAIENYDMIFASIKNNTLTLTPTKIVVGTTEVTISGTTNDKTEYYTFSIEVLDHAPVLNVAIGQQDLFKNAEAFDIDLGQLFSDEDDPFIGLSIVAVSNDILTSTLLGSTLTITPEAGMSGEAEITIEGTSGDNSISSSFTVSIVDRAPEVTLAFNKVDAIEDDAPVKVDLSSHFSDPDGDAISYEVTGNSNSDLLTATIDGAELNIEFTADAYGTGELEISATADGKTIKSSIAVDVAKKVGINEFDQNSKLSVYPNPVKENLSVLWTGQNDLSEVQVSVVDLTGRVLISKDLQQLNANQVVSIPMNNISQGIYIVRIVSAEIRFNTQISK